MTLVATLFIVGLILLSFEIIVPGGILGVMGGVALLGGCVVSFQHFGATGGWLTVLAAVVLVGLMLAIEFVVLPRTPWGKKMFLRAQVTGSSQRTPNEGSLLGQSAVAVTTLAPSGYVTVGGRQHEAFCRSGYVAAGTTLRVTAVENFRLVVSTE